MSKGTAIKIALAASMCCSWPIMAYIFVQSDFLFYGVQAGDALAIAVASGLLALWLGLIILSVVFLIKEYKVRRQLEKAGMYDIVEINVIEDCITECDEYIEAHKSGAFIKEVRYLREQTDRLLKKRDSMRKVLARRFDPSTLTYGSYETAISQLNDLFKTGIKSCLDRLWAFDDSDYRQPRLFGKVQAEKLQILKEYRDFMVTVIETGEDILLRYDKLSLEVMKLTTVSEEELAELMESTDIDNLINVTKQYK